MLKRILLAPGRVLLHLLTSEKKRKYRSARSRPSVGLGAIVLSLISWLIIAGGILYAVDRAGLLKQALDAGVETIAGTSGEDPAGAGQDPSNETAGSDRPGPESDTTTATGVLTGGADGNASGPAGTNPAVGTTLPAGSGTSQLQTAEMWVVMLHSIPKTASDARGEANRQQRQYRNKGLDVDVLDSDAFPLLVGGYWVVALGPFEDKLSATMAANKALQFNAQLMVRRGM